MPNRQTDTLFQLIKSLEKAEKRNFKLYAGRNTGGTELKMVHVFDAIDKMHYYDEELLMKKNNIGSKAQLANVKAHLYKQVLNSLRLIKTNENIDMQLHEQLDHARILYNKGLYLHSLKILDKVKETAAIHHQDSVLGQAISLEKKIETLHITRSLQNRAEQLSAESLAVNTKRLNITKLSNLALLLYSWYIKNGHARNADDVRTLDKFFKDHMQDIAVNDINFYEQLYLYQSFTWYAFIKQNFLDYYKYTSKWVQLFDEEPSMIPLETAHYIKGLHNLLNALFDIKYYSKNEEVLKKFETFAQSDIAKQNENIEAQTFIYYKSGKLNRYISTGSFYKGIILIPKILDGLKKFGHLIDEHRILVLNYKIATIYFGQGDYDTCIDYLRKIINDNPGLRTDIQCYARLLHLIAHYELGNYDIIESLTKSVYRFMAKMQNLTRVEEEMLAFIRRSFNLNPRKVHHAFTSFYETIKQFENSPLEARAYAYLDVHSWVESKLEGKPMAAIIKEKYLSSKRK